MKRAGLSQSPLSDVRRQFYDSLLCFDNLALDALDALDARARGSQQMVDRDTRTLGVKVTPGGKRTFFVRITGKPGRTDPCPASSAK